MCVVNFAYGEALPSFATGKGIPSFGKAEIHPFVALWKDRRISPRARGDQRSERWIGGRFWKSDGKLLNRLRL